MKYVYFFVSLGKDVDGLKNGNSGVNPGVVLTFNSLQITGIRTMVGI